MQVAVSVIMPQRLGGISGKVVYIDTVRTFNPARFRGNPVYITVFIII